MAMDDPNFLPVLGQDGSFVEDAALLMLGAMNYPTCPRSIAHYKSIVSTDEEEQTGTRSLIGDVVARDTIGRKRQGYVAGEVALRLIEMSVHGPEPSMNKAIYIVRRTLKDTKVLESDGTLKDFKPKSEKGVRDAITDFRPVCHLWAAHRINPDLFVETAKSEDALAKFLAVSAVLETRLDEILAKDGWSPWRIPNELRREDFGLRIPELSDFASEYLRDYHPALR